MAGKNQILQTGQVLFKAGDPSNGMFIIRKGELQVYLEQAGKQVALANVSDGGIIGEMALFDLKPRSASVKATKETEVSHISNDDFAMLMKQIPKWFVTLMSSLSTRLRQTNERLQRLEGMSTQKPRPFMWVSKILHVLVLLWHKDGEKDGREWTLDKDKAVNSIKEMFDEDPVRLKSFFDLMGKHKIVLQKSTTPSTCVLSLPNRGILEKFNVFLNEFVKKSPAQPYLTEAAINMIKTFIQASKASAYDTVSCSIAELEVEGKKMTFDTTNWKAEIANIKYIGNDVAVTKTSDGSIGIRGQKKDLTPLVMFHELIADLYKSNLSQ